MENAASVQQFTKMLTVIDAVNWIALACKNVKPESVCKCFRKDGFLPHNEYENAIPYNENVAIKMDPLCEELNHHVD